MLLVGRARHGLGSGFRLRRIALPLVVTAVGFACSSARDSRQVLVAISPAIVLPEGVLDNAQTLDLTVYDSTAGVGCDTPSGTATGVTGTTAKLATVALGTTGCTGSAKFCGSLNLTKSSDTYVFAAQALDASKSVIANGCATATVNQDALGVSITMLRYVTPATCGNGVIEATEQCDPPGTAGEDGGTDGGTSELVCDPNCHSVEETLSVGATSPTGPSYFLWPAQSGTSGELYAFFTEKPASTLDVGLRVMSDALEGVTTPIAAEQSLLAPDGTGYPPSTTQGDQQQPSAALVNGVYYYAFNDNEANGDPDIHLRAFDSTLTDIGGLIGINGPNGAGESNAQVFPSVAANSSGVLYIAWEDANSGAIYGRTYNPSADAGSALGTEDVLSTGTGNEGVQVAATTNGWIAAWDNGQVIKMRVISAPGGTPNGPEITVSNASHTGTQENAGVAVLSDGRAAVVWTDLGSTQGDIFVQRYDQDLTPVADDQAVPINDLVTLGQQGSPVIAGTSAAGGSFVAAWLDSTSGDIRGAVLDGTSGYLFNPIDGQATEFKATLSPDPTRENPVIAIGGSGSAGPWVAIGWDDGTAVYARRFPTSTE